MLLFLIKKLHQNNQHVDCVNLSIFTQFIPNFYIYVLFIFQVQALRVILSSVQAKSKERQWLRHQTSGELDDIKLVEGNFYIKFSFLHLRAYK